MSSQSGEGKIIQLLRLIHKDSLDMNAAIGDLALEVTAEQINLNTDELEGNTERSSFEKMKATAVDLVRTFNYSDAGTADERVTSIVYTSASFLPATTCTETFAYGGVSGGYYVTSITLSIT